MTTTDLKRALGKLIFDLRRERGLSQEKLALEANVDRTWMGEIERGDANPTIDILEKIARVLGQTIGSLMLQAEEISSGVTRRPAPKLNPVHIDRTVPLPHGLTHDQLERALNQSLARLDQLGVNPEDRDIPWNIYSSAVAKIVARAIAETSDLTYNHDIPHPDLYHPDLDPTDLDWGLEISATQHVGKGGEVTVPHQGWLMIVVYKVIEHQTHIIQVEIALLSRAEWVIHERGTHPRRTRTAVTIASATDRLRENSVYLDPRYVPPSIRRIADARRRARLY